MFNNFEILAVICAIEYVLQSTSFLLPFDTCIILSRILAILGHCYMLLVMFFAKQMYEISTKAVLFYSRIFIYKLNTRNWSVNKNSPRL